MHDLSLSLSENAQVRSSEEKYGCDLNMKLSNVAYMTSEVAIQDTLRIPRPGIGQSRDCLHIFFTLRIDQTVSRLPYQI